MVMPPLPPNLDPSRYVAPPPPPRRPRPSGWWFALGGALLVLAVAVGVALFAWTLHGFLKVDDTISADGQSHIVLLEPHEQKMLWSHETGPARCTITDRATAAPLDTSAPGASFTRSGSTGSWVGVRRFDSGSGQLEVTCVASAGPAQIGPAPQFGSFMGGIFATILVPLVLGLLGLLVLVITGVRFATGAPRTTRGNHPA